MKLAIIYYSKTGNTKMFGECIKKGMENIGAEVRMYDLEKPMDVDYINSCDGIVFGTPTYYASFCWQIKKWFDEDASPYTLQGKLGGVYATANHAQGGADIACLSLVGHMLVKGMLAFSGGGAYGKPIVHVGPVALGAVDGHFDAMKPLFETYGERFASKAKELFGE